MGPMDRVLMTPAYPHLHPHQTLDLARFFELLFLWVWLFTHLFLCRCIISTASKQKVHVHKRAYPFATLRNDISLRSNQLAKLLTQHKSTVAKTQFSDPSKTNTTRVSLFLLATGLLSLALVCLDQVFPHAALPLK